MYSGSKDSLNLQLQIFYNNCRKAGITSEGYADAFDTMLKGDAREYYYDQISSRIPALTFEEMIATINAHFETDEHRCRLMITWNNLSLMQLVSISDKTTIECLDDLIKQIQHTQRGLPASYKTEQMLIDRMVTACANVEECSRATFRPATTFEALCTDL